MRSRKKVIQGGTSAGKTIAILCILINDAINNPGLEISVVSETFPHLRKGAIRDFKKIMQIHNRWLRSRWNQTDHLYTFSNGSFIEFFSADNEGKVRGPRRTKLYINEANRLRYDTYHQLAMRTEKDIYLDYNPSAEFWAQTEVLEESDSELLILNYKDNEGLPKNVLKEFEEAQRKADAGSKYWKNWVRVYVEGKTGRLQGLVFEDWEEVEELPSAARLQGYGIDFGFSNSAFAMVAIYKMDGAYYFDEVVYGTGMTNQVAAQLAIEKGVNTDIQCYADSAEPKSIEEMCVAGLNVIKCDSKVDIRDYSIRRMQGQTFYVTKNSKNLIDNLNRFKWAEDKHGQPTNKPIKDHDHAIDAIIYFIGTDDKYSGEY